MPHYYLHMRCAGEAIPDEEGVGFPDLAAAVREAVRGARSIMSAEVLEGRLLLDQLIEIHDAQDHPVATVRFAEAVEIAGQPVLPTKVESNG